MNARHRRSRNPSAPPILHFALQQTAFLFCNKQPFQSENQIGQPLVKNKSLIEKEEPGPEEKEDDSNSDSQFHRLAKQQAKLTKARKNATVLLNEFLSCKIRSSS